MSHRFYRPEAILFDLGDTILGNQRFDPVAGNTRLLQFVEHTDLSPAEVQQVADELDARINPLRSTTLIEFTAESFNRLLFECLGMQLSISPAQAAYEFWHASVTFSPEPGINDVLGYLQDTAIRRGIISNAVFSGSVLESELDKHGLRQSFEFLLSSADYGLRKPHSLLFEVGLARLGLKPEAVWFVGDNPDTDIAGAQSIGLCGGWYNRRQSCRQEIIPDIEVHSWPEFLRLLRDL